MTTNDDRTVMAPHFGPCPTCGYKWDAATEIANTEDPDKPVSLNVGAYTVCLNCGQIVEVGIGFVPIPRELHEIALEQQDLRALQVAARAQSEARRMRFERGYDLTGKRGKKATE